MQGKKHTLLGIKFEILNDGNIQLDMKYQTQEAINDFEDTISINVSTPCMAHLIKS